MGERTGEGRERDGKKGVREDGSRGFREEERMGTWELARRTYPKLLILRHRFNASKREKSQTVKEESAAKAKE